MSTRMLRVGAWCTAASGCVFGALAITRRLNRWGATDDEVSRALPGDDDVAHPCVATTRAITIGAPAEAVWPWLVQMGWRRGGWYSFNAIDNNHLPSADHIIPALQAELRVGDFVPEGEGVGWTVTEIEPGRFLLLTSHGPMVGVDWIERRDSSWLFLIEPVDAEHSRLIERARTGVRGTPGKSLGDFASSRFFGSALAVGDFVMAHRHMNGLKRRAEREWVSPGRKPAPPFFSRRAVAGMGSVHLDAAVDIERSPEEVFDYCSDHAHEPEWNPMMKGIEKLTEGPIGVGTRYCTDLVKGPPMVMECTAYERPSTWSLVGESSALRTGGEWRIVATSEGVHLAMHTELELRGLLRMATPFVRRRLQPMFQRDLENIKVRLEGAEAVLRDSPDDARANDDMTQQCAARLQPGAALSSEPGSAICGDV